MAQTLCFIILWSLFLKATLQSLKLHPLVGWIEILSHCENIPYCYKSLNLQSKNTPAFSLANLSWHVGPPNLAILPRRERPESGLMSMVIRLWVNKVVLSIRGYWRMLSVLKLQSAGRPGPARSHPHCSGSKWSCVSSTLLGMDTWFPVVFYNLCNVMLFTVNWMYTMWSFVYQSFNTVLMLLSELALYSGAHERIR